MNWFKIHKPSNRQEKEDDTLRQYSVLNMTNGEKTALLMFAMILQLISYLLWDIFVLYHPSYHAFVHLPVIFIKIQAICLSILVCLGMMWLAIRRVRSDQFNHRLMVAAVVLYVLDLMLMGWFSGLFTVALGVVLAGATFVGVLMLPPILVLTAALFATFLLLGLGAATIYLGLPYAPIFKQQIIGLNLDYTTFYFVSQFYFSIPFLMVVLLMAYFFLKDWKRREALFKRTSERDGLTQLFNRRIAQDKLLAALKVASGEPVSVVLVDLDFFKAINDTYGHLVGDQVLQATANSLQAAARQHDIVARFGGEEFLLVLVNTSHEAARQAAERHRRKIEQILVIAEQQQVVRLTASFGVATVLSGHDVSPDFVLKEADAALYQAKEDGRNQVVGRDYSQDVLQPTQPFLRRVTIDELRRS